MLRVVLVPTRVVVGVRFIFMNVVVVVENIPFRTTPHRPFVATLAPTTVVRRPPTHEDVVFTPCAFTTIACAITTSIHASVNDEEIRIGSRNELSTHRAIHSPMDVDYAAVSRIATAATYSALGGVVAGVALATARGRTASTFTTYALNTCANFTTIGTAYAVCYEAFARTSDGARDVVTATSAGACVGGGTMWAHKGRGAALGGVVMGAAASALASALVEWSEAEKRERESGEDAPAFAFPSWSPVQIVREGEEDEGELRARMDAAMRGELSASEEAKTRDDYLRWKMRRAERGRS